MAVPSGTTYPGSSLFPGPTGGGGSFAIIVAHQPNNAPPRNQLTVVNGTGATVTVSRAASDGVITPVRGAEPAPLSGGEWIGYDYEAPYGDAVTYSAMDALGNVATVLVGPLGVTQSWLVHPGVPSLSQPLNRITLGDRQNDTGAAQHVILGRTSPITVTDGTRKADQLPLNFRTDAAFDEINMNALLQDASTLLLQIVYPFTNAFEYRWIQAGQVQVHRVTMNFGDAKRTWSVACTVTDRPAGNIASQRQWATVLGEAATWGDVLSRYTTWGGVLTGIAGT